MNRSTASLPLADDVLDPTRTEHQLSHFRLDAQDVEFFRLKATIHALLVQLWLRRREVEPLMPVVGDPLARALLQELREIETESVLGTQDEGRNPHGAWFAGGRMLDGLDVGLGRRLLSHAILVELEMTFDAARPSSPPRNRDPHSSYRTPWTRGQPRFDRFRNCVGAS